MADETNTTQDQGTDGLDDQQGLDADESQNEGQNEGQQDGQQNAGADASTKTDGSDAATLTPEQIKAQKEAAKAAEKAAKEAKKAAEKAAKEAKKAAEKAERDAAKAARKAKPQFVAKPLVEVNETELDALSTALENVFLAASGNLTIAEATERPASDALIGIAELSGDEVAAEIEALGDPREKVMASVGAVNTLKNARRTIDAALVKLIGMAEHRHRQTEALVNVYELERLRLLQKAVGNGQ